MLKFGVITNIDETKAKARVKFAEDDLLSYWLPVLQTKTFKDKYYVLPDINEQVVCLMDENIEDGVILGSVYSDIDIAPVFSKDKAKIIFSDSTEIEYDRIEHTLNIICPNINIQGIINHTGVLFNSAGVLSEGDVFDKKGSIQAIRGIYNSHTHNETNSVTQIPNQMLL